MARTGKIRAIKVVRDYLIETGKFPNNSLTTAVMIVNTATEHGKAVFLSLTVKYDGNRAEAYRYSVKDANYVKPTYFYVFTITDTQTREKNIYYVKATDKVQATVILAKNTYISRNETVSVRKPENQDEYYYSGYYS